MRSRNLKPGLFHNELLGSADPLITILFEGLWCVADREGRLEDRALRLCAQLFPYRRSVTEKKVDSMLRWLHENGFIVRYEIDGRRFIQVIEFLKHQNPHKNEAPSKIQSLVSIQHSTSTGASTVPESEHSSASTEGAPDKHPSARASSLIPDSLIPDSSLRALGAHGPSPSPGLHESTLPDDREAFERVKAAYPEFAGNQSDWLMAEKACQLRVQEGATWSELEAAASRFAAFVAGKGRSSPRYVDLPSKFFGNGLWREEWRAPPSKSDQRLDSNLAAAAEAKRRLAGGST